MLNTVKTLLGFTSEDTEQDAKLKKIIELTTARLKALIGNVEPPEELDYIITEVTIMRFNRIGSEGLSSHSVEGESMTFTDDDFDKFNNDIQVYLQAQSDSTRGRLRFL